MAFDAGTIDARLTVDPAEADRTLRDFEAKVEKFEREPHKVKIAAVFDQSSMTRARKMFSDLDNAISKDAMNRLRSSPQGSVLGSINALFSPHPVTGAPSPSQSAQGGLLGKMLSPASGGSTIGGGGNSSPLVAALAQNAYTTDNIRQNLTGTGAADTTTTDSIRQALIGQGATDVTTTDKIRQQLTGSTPGNISTEDMIKQVLTGSTPGNISTQDTIKQVLAGQGAANTTTTDKIMQELVGKGPGNTSTTDLVKEQLDPKSTGDVEDAAKSSGGRAGGQWTVGFGAHLGPFFATFRKKLGDAGSSGGAAMGKGLIGGIGPGILGIGALFATKWVGGIGTALAALPAVAGLAGTGIGVALIGGITLTVAKGAITAVQPLVAAYGKLQSAAPGPAQVTALKNYNAQLAQMSPAQRSLAKSIEGMQKAWQGFIKSNTAGVSTILSGGMGLLPGIINQMNGVFRAVVPQMASIFANLGGVINGLLGVAKTAVPAFAPFINAILGLVKNILPGVSMVIKATIPFISQFAGVLGKLGSGLGGLFATAAPAIGASMKILSALLGLVSDLLPVIMQVADVFAKTLAPVFTVLVGAITPLLPVLVTVAKVIADFAGAVIGDLASAIGAVASLFKAIGPSLATFATAISGVFTVLENSGVFAELGNALESAAGPLGKMISALIDGLAPILPPIIQFVGQVAAILAGGLAAAIIAVLPSLTQLATTVLGAIAKILPVVLPLLTKMAGLFTGALAGAIAMIVPPLAKLATGVFTDMANILPVVLPSLIMMLGAFTPVVAGAIGVIATALAAIITAIPPAVIADLALGFLAIAGAIKLWAIAQGILDIALNANPIGLIVLAVAVLTGAVYELVTHWTQVWGEIRKIAGDAWRFLGNVFHNGIVQDILDVDTLGLLPLAQHWKQVWGDITGWLSGAWKIIDNILRNGIVNDILAVVAPMLYLSLHWKQIWGDIQTVAKDFWTWLSTVFGTDLSGFFTKTIPGWWNEMWGDAKKFATNIENAVKAIWTWLTGTFGPDILRFFTVTIPGYWNTAVADAKKFAANIINGVKAIWTWLTGTFGPDILRFFTATIPGYWNTAVTDAGKFAANVINGVKKVWTWLSGTFGPDVEKFFTTTLPGWFNTAVGAVGRFWNRLEQTVSKPVKWVLRNVVDPLFGAIDDVTNFVGMGKPLPANLASGGKLAGYGGGDVIPALLEPGEAVVDKDTTRRYAALFKMMGVPGFAAGGQPGGRGGALGAQNPTGGNVLGGILGDIGSFFKGLVFGGLDLAKIGLDLAHGDSGGAERALLSLLGVSGSGGAAGQISKVLLALPGTLATDVMKYLVGPVEKWVTGQQSSPVGNIGSGVKRWTSLVLQALKMEGLPSGDLGLVLRQITSESGGNPNAINLTDINAQQGDPSRGLLQTIMTTFQAYHWPGTSGNIYDPLANIAAALNYAVHTVGIGPHPGQLGGGSGYALGGPINEMVIGYGVNSGRRYTFGENGPEYVTPGGKPPGGSDPALLARMDQLIAVTRQIPAGVGGSVGGALGGAAHAASFRSRYPRGS